MVSLEVIQKFSQESKLPITEHPYGSGQYLIRSGSSHSSIQKKVAAFNQKYGTNITCWNDRSRDATFVG